MQTRPILTIPTTAKSRAWGRVANIGFALAAAFISLGVDCGDQCSIELASPLTVVSVAPSHGAIDIGVDATVILAFSDELDEESVASAISLANQEVVVDCAMSLSESGRLVVLTPSASLAPATTYHIRIASTLAGVNSGELGVNLEYRFTTK
jgi:hypothetical protein